MCLRYYNKWQQTKNGANVNAGIGHGVWWDGDEDGHFAHHQNDGIV